MIFLSDFGEAKLKKEEKQNLQGAIHESVPFAVLLALVGGFLDAYTFIGRGGVFANAQTGNVVLVGVYAAQGEWIQALVHIPPILAFVLGVIVAELMKKYAARRFISDWIKAVLMLEIIVLIIIGFIPQSVPNIVVTVIVSFVASVQVSSFRKLVDSPYSTTMITGNLRTAAQAVYIACVKKDREAARRAMRFILIIFSFLAGALFSGLLMLMIGVKAIWGAAIILAAAVILFRASS